MKKCLIAVILLCTWVVPAFAQEKSQFVVHEQLIFAPQHEHTHGSSLVLLPNGDKLACWFQGSGERKSDDVRIMGARLVKGSGDWSVPFLMADTKGLPDCNPVLFLNGDDKLFLVWIAVQANRWETSILRFRTSVDYDGEGAPQWNWQDNILLKPDESFAQEVERRFKDLPKNQLGWAEYAPRYDDMIVEASKDAIKRSIGWMTRIKPLILDGGKILLPLYSDGFNFSMVAISEDHGDSWRPSLPIVGRGPIQPALVQRRNGEIVAYMRDSGNPPARVHQSVSRDEGESWSATIKTDIPNTASVELLCTKRGTWVWLGNDITDGRYRLSLYLSDDEGATWNWKVRVEDHNKGTGSFSYPCLVEDEAGLLHMTYSFRTGETESSIKYVVVDPKKIKG
ncbi:MAG: sialidase family protein [Bacteroidota bacterium]